MSVKSVVKLLGPYFLFSSWPFISFWDHNKLEIAKFDDLFVTAFAVISVGLLLIGGMRLLFPGLGIQRIGLVVGIGIATLFSYQVVVAMVQFSGGWWGIYYLVGWVLSFLIAVAIGLYVGKDHRKTQIAVIVGATLVTIPVLSLAWNATKTQEIFRTTTVNTLGTESAPDNQQANLPNIYYFILDAYARADVLKKYFTYDNKEFLGALESEGFRIVTQSHSNYAGTLYSVSTTLNNAYYLPSGPGSLGRVDPQSPIFDSIKGRPSVVFNRLRELGYTIYYANHKGSTETNCKPYCLTGKAFLSPLQFELLRMTPVYGVLNEWHNDVMRNWGLFNQKSLDPVIERLPSLKPDPVFLFAHILSPHSPLIYKQDCTERQKVELQLEIKDNKLPAATTKQHYVEEIMCLNSRVRDAIRRIVKMKPNAIIIVQSDHGTVIPGQDTKGDAQLIKLRFANLNALRLPNRCKSYVYPTMSLVNTFRIVLGCIERNKPNLLPDRIFHIENDSFVELP
ncbi:MAG: sulfatase-like hydrolase/transferase [Alphaproteobacteria bacterium]|nr:sulfatase-like hydrolase/transferase [Alphaproteobacteria bacterium]